MMDAFERFGLIINDHVVRTPVAIASMAGIVDARDVLTGKRMQESRSSEGTQSIGPPRMRRVR